VGRVLQDDAAAQEPGGRVDDALLVGTAQAQVGEDVVDVAGALDAGQLLADEQPMGGLGDPDVAGAGGQDDDGEVEARDRLDEERAIRGRGLPGLVDDLDDEARSTRRVQAGEEVAGAAHGTAEPRAAAEDELAALQEGGHLVRLRDVHPADRIAQARGPAQHLGASAADLIEVEDRTDRDGGGDGVRAGLRPGDLRLHVPILQSVSICICRLTLCPWSE
jgi:hypothetical protein